MKQQLVALTKLDTFEAKFEEEIVGSHRIVPAAKCLLLYFQVQF
jgi:hypothetical protein